MTTLPPHVLRPGPPRCGPGRRPARHPGRRAVRSADEACRGATEGSVGLPCRRGRQGRLGREGRPRRHPRPADAVHRGHARDRPGRWGRQPAARCVPRPRRHRGGGPFRPGRRPGGPREWRPPVGAAAVGGGARYLEPTGRAVGWPKAGSDDIVEVVPAPVTASCFTPTAWSRPSVTSCSPTPAASTTAWSWCCAVPARSAPGGCLSRQALLPSRDLPDGRCAETDRRVLPTSTHTSAPPGAGAPQTGRSGGPEEHGAREGSSG